MERSHRAGALARRLAAAAAAEEPLPTPDAVFALVYRQMRALAGHRDVDELVQVAAEQAIRGLPGFAGRSKLSTWTFRICHLTVLKHDRWYRRWLRRFTLTQDGELPERAGDAVPDEARLIDGERVRRLRAGLDTLSPRRRAVLVLHDLEGLSIEEVAEIVVARPIAVRSRLRDARATLAKALSADPYFGDEPCRRKDPP
jgi:RNA polymerase sigma-70 factor (ECF subfamily)